MTKTLEQLHQETWPDHSFDDFIELLSLTAYPVGIYGIEEPYETWKEQLLEMKARSGSDWERAIGLEETEWGAIVVTTVVQVTQSF